MGRIKNAIGPQNRPVIDLVDDSSSDEEDDVCEFMSLLLPKLVAPRLKWNVRQETYDTVKALLQTWFPEKNFSKNIKIVAKAYQMIK